MPARNLYLLHFNGRHDNLGDQFIFQALVRALADLGTVHMRGAAPAFLPPSSSMTSGGLELGWRSAMTTLRGGAVYTFFPPGGRTWTAAPPSSSSPVRGAMAALKKTALGAVAGRRIAIGASVIPAANHAWCQECDWVGVRDQESLDALRAAGLSRVEYFPDLSFLPPPPRHAADDAAAPRRGLRVSFRQSIPEWRGDPQTYTSQLVAAFGALARSLDEDARREAQAFHQVEEDEAFTRGLGQAHGIPFHGARVALDSFEAFYGGADIVVSNRLHCLLMGAHCGAVPVALTSRAHTKVTSLFDTVGWSSLVLPIEEVDALPRRFAAVQQQITPLRRMVATSFDEQRRLGLRLLEQRFGPRRALM